MLGLIDSDKQLTTGWKHRLTSLLPSIDPEQVLARMRTDGAAWFLPEFGLDDELGEVIDTADSLEELALERDLLEDIEDERERSDSIDVEDADD